MWLWRISERLQELIAIDSANVPPASWLQTAGRKRGYSREKTISITTEQSNGHGQSRSSSMASTLLQSHGSRSASSRCIADASAYCANFPSSSDDPKKWSDTEKRVYAPRSNTMARHHPACWACKAGHFRTTCGWPQERSQLGYAGDNR